MTIGSVKKGEVFGMKLRFLVITWVKEGTIEERRNGRPGIV